jgi:hypothetical protein
VYPVLLIAAALIQQPKIDIQTVAPNEQGMAYTISPKGAHVVAITQKGTRWVILRPGWRGRT